MTVKIKEEEEEGRGGADDFEMNMRDFI